MLNYFSKEELLFVCELTEIVMSFINVKLVYSRKKLFNTFAHLGKK